MTVYCHARAQLPREGTGLKDPSTRFLLSLICNLAKQKVLTYSRLSSCVLVQNIPGLKQRYFAASGQPFFRRRLKTHGFCSFMFEDRN